MHNKEKPPLSERRGHFVPLILFYCTKNSVKEMRARKGVFIAGADTSCLCIIYFLNKTAIFGCITRKSPSVRKARTFAYVTALTEGF